MYIQRAKQELWAQLSGSVAETKVGYHSRIEADIRARLDIAFNQRMSTSLLVIGPTGSGKKAVINNVLRSYQDCEGFTPFSIARVQAQICPTDQEALCSIAGQLCIRNSAGRSLVTALEDLEDHFRQCALNAQPSVVVLEDIHSFASREKQVLIYTLLDYMHKSDMLFVVIGYTPCAHLQTMLEKRILSRLNAQFVYVAPATGPEVCESLSQKLTLSMNKTHDDAEIDFRQRFNAEVVALFGPHEYSRDIGSKKKKTSPHYHIPLLLDVISRYADWGKGLDHFIRAAQVAVVGLTIAQSVFTQNSWEKALYSQDPCTLTERLSSLPLHELHIFASAARCHARMGLALADNKGGTAVKNRRDSSINVSDVLEELDRLTGVLRRRESTQARALQGLHYLVREGLILLLTGNKVTPSQVVTNQTLVVMMSPSYEVKEAFQATVEDATGSRGRVHVPLMVSDRVRRAVLEPAEVPPALMDRL